MSEQVPKLLEVARSSDTKEVVLQLHKGTQQCCSNFASTEYSSGKKNRTMSNFFKTNCINQLRIMRAVPVDNFAVAVEHFVLLLQWSL